MRYAALCSLLISHYSLEEQLQTLKFDIGGYYKKAKSY